MRVRRPERGGQGVAARVFFVLRAGRGISTHMWAARSTCWPLHYISATCCLMGKRPWLAHCMRRAMPAGVSPAHHTGMTFWIVQSKRIWCSDLARCPITAGPPDRHFGHRHAHPQRVRVGMGVGVRVGMGVGWGWG